MAIYFSAKEVGFFHDNIHGRQVVRVPDPDWIMPEHPTVRAGGAVIPDPEWEPPEHPHVEVETRPSTMPADAVEISEEKWRELLKQQQETGRPIVAGPKGAPVLGEITKKT